MIIPARRLLIKSLSCDHRKKNESDRNFVAALLYPAVFVKGIHDCCERADTFTVQWQSIFSVFQKIKCRLSVDGRSKQEGEMFVSGDT